MAYDPYAPCPCGSGKKLKFCCQAIADEMDRIHRLIENNQLRAALHQLDLLDKRHPQNEWITTTRAMLLIETGETVAARDLLRPWVASHPDSDFATCLYATTQLGTEGYDAAKKSIQRAYHKGARHYSALVSGLAAAVAAVMDARNQPLAQRESLALALRFAPDEQRQDLFIQLLEFDSGQDVYYPLRSVHPLPSVEMPAEHDKDYKRALKLTMIGCWDSAADLFTMLAETLPDRPELLQSAGLCRAFDGDSVRAAEMLHRAAAKVPDFSIAVECEALAQLIEMNHQPDGRAFLIQEGTVSSVSRVLSALDEEPRAVRLQLPQELSEQETPPSALYQFLDRPALTEQDVPTLSRAALPKSIGTIFVFDAQGEQPARLIVHGLEGPAFDKGLEQLRTLLGDQVTWPSEPPRTQHRIPTELEIFEWRWSFPPKTPLNKRQELEREQWRDVLGNIWPDRPQRALSGKSPREAAQDPELRTAVTAAVYVLDAICEQLSHSLDVKEIFARLGLEPLPPLTLSPDSAPNSLSLIQMHRLDLPSLTDDQLLSVMNRAMLVRHGAFLRPVLEETLRREISAPDMNYSRIFQMIMDLSARQGFIADALHWLEAARRKLLGEHPSFEEVWTWDLRELMLRLSTPDDPALRPLVQKFAGYYSPKVPHLRPYLEAMLENAGVESPWSGSGILTPELAAAEAGSGSLWSPEQSAAPPSGGKLWLPGQ